MVKHECRRGMQVSRAAGPTTCLRQRFVESLFATVCAHLFALQSFVDPCARRARLHLRSVSLPRLYRSLQQRPCWLLKCVPLRVCVRELDANSRVARRLRRSSWRTGCCASTLAGLVRTCACAMRRREHAGMHLCDARTRALVSQCQFALLFLALPAPSLNPFPNCLSSTNGARSG